MRAANKKFTRIRRYVSCFGPVLTNVLNTMVRSQASLKVEHGKVTVELTVNMIQWGSHWR